MKATDYLRAAKARTGKDSDYALAQALQVTRQQVSKWQRGIDVPAPLVAYRLAALLQLDPAAVVADIEAERAERAGKTDQVQAWREFSEKLSATAAVLFLIFGVSISPDSQASIGNKSHPDIGEGQSVYYVKLLRALMRALRHGLPLLPYSQVPTVTRW